MGDLVVAQLFNASDDVRLSHRVQCIVQSGESCQVEYAVLDRAASNDKVLKIAKAKYVISTIPIGPLKENAKDLFSPPLSNNNLESFIYC